MTAYEIRNLAPAEARAEVTEDGRSFHGHAAVYETRIAIGNPRGFGFFEELADHAARDTTERGDDIRFLIEHEPRYIVARTRAGTLELSDDSPVGWAAYVPALDTDLSYVRDMKVNLRNGNLSSMSFAFRVPRGGDTWTEIRAKDEDGEFDALLRRVHTFTGFDVSVVAYPAYTETDAALRSAATALAATADPELIASRLEIAPELAPALADVADHAIRSDPHNAEGKRHNQAVVRAIVMASLARQLDTYGAICVRGAIAAHSTKVVDEPWDGPAAVAAAPNTPAVLRYMHAWVDGQGDPTAKKSYKFPHHAPRAGAPANINGVNNAMARLSEAKGLSDADRAGVRRHLKRHQADWKAAQGK